MANNPNRISFNVFNDRTMNNFNANQCNIEAAEMDDDAYTNQLYDTARADDKENDLQSKPF